MGLPGPKGDAGDSALEAGLSESVLQLNGIIEELRGQIRELRDRVAILEISAGENSETVDSFLSPASISLASPTSITTTSTTTRPTVNNLRFRSFISHFF